MNGRFVVATVAIVAPLIPGVMALRQLGRKRAWEHLERMKALELGLPMPERAVWPTHVWIALVYVAMGALMPAGVVFIGWLDHMTVEASDEGFGFGLGAGTIGIVGVFYSTFFYAIATFAARDRPRDPNRVGFLPDLFARARAVFGARKGSKGAGYDAKPGFEPEEQDFAGPYG